MLIRTGSNAAAWINPNLLCLHVHQWLQEKKGKSLNALSAYLVVKYSVPKIYYLWPKENLMEEN